MNPSSCLRVHLLVRCIKQKGFWLETQELEEMGVIKTVQELYGLEPCLSQEEWELLEAELLTLAECNEMREAQVKHRELEPEDSGVMLIHQVSEGRDSVTSYPLPYSHPVDENLRQVRTIRKPRPASLKKQRQKGREAIILEDDT